MTKRNIGDQITEETLDEMYHWNIPISVGMTHVCTDVSIAVSESQATK
jgi:hypothetical protein